MGVIIAGSRGGPAFFLAVSPYSVGGYVKRGSFCPKSFRGNELRRFSILLLQSRSKISPK